MKRGFVLTESEKNDILNQYEKNLKRRTIDSNIVISTLHNHYTTLLPGVKIIFFRNF